MKEKEECRKPLPSFIEILAIWILANVISLAVALLIQPYVSFGIFISYSSHIPQFLIPWIWFNLRMKPALPTEKGKLFSWGNRSVKLFLFIAIILAGLNLLDEMVEGRGMSQPLWIENGLLSIILMLVFQGIFVGFAEEMLVRPSFHLPLKLKWAGKSKIPWALIVTSIAFGSFHLNNYFLGQAFVPTVIQAISAFFVSLIFGYFYEKTDNYVGTALLHNIFDVAGAIGIIIITLK